MDDKIDISAAIGDALDIPAYIDNQADHKYRFQEMTQPQSGPRSECAPQLRAPASTLEQQGLSCW